jgi:hypothetical protein
VDFRILGPHGPERWDRAGTQGAALTVHEAIDLALEADPLASAGGTAARLSST